MVASDSLHLYGLAYSRGEEEEEDEEEEKEEEEEAEEEEEEEEEEVELLPSLDFDRRDHVPRPKSWTISPLS
eukprot:jgi/Botrbrau1/5054/Bobra.37_1s0019.1